MNPKFFQKNHFFIKKSETVGSTAKKSAKKIDKLKVFVYN